MAYTLGEAARATGISKTSIQRALKNGRISGQKDDKGEWQIDPAELHRVYPLRGSDKGSGNLDVERTGTPKDPSETEVLRREVELLRERLADKDEVISDLRERLDQSEQERREKDRQLTALLTDQRASEQGVPKPSVVKRLFGRRAG